MFKDEMYRLETPRADLNCIGCVVNADTADVAKSVTERRNFMRETLYDMNRVRRQSRNDGTLDFVSYETTRRSVNGIELFV